MEMFDIGLVKREPLDEFNSDSTYFDQIMPYNSDVFDTSVDWLSSFAEERSSVHSMDHLNTMSDYSNIVLTSINRDQTLNRLNEFDHRLEGNHDLDCEMKSFYSTHHHHNMFTQGYVPDTMVGCAADNKVHLQKHDLAAVPVKLEELEETARLSGESDQEREESESGEAEQNSQDISMNCEYLELKSCYDSGARSPNSDTPGTPPQCLILGQVEHDRTSYSSGDVTPPGDQPKTRQPFFLSEEEKRTLVTEGLPIPSGYPLTKSEERSLKKVRRKIKNKISAQESRRKKKEYMETLEKRVELCTHENLDLRKRLESMETTNRNLINQLKKLQAIVASRVPRPMSTIATQTIAAGKQEETSS